jgi:hypothetical protein
MTEKTKNELRQERLAEIAKSAEDARKDEMTDLDEGDDTDVTPVIADSGAAPGQADAEDASGTKPVDKPSMVKVKVNGEEKELPLDEVIAGYQKNTAADQNLQSAAEALRLAAEASKTSSTDESEKVDYKALARALQMGTEDEAEQAVKKLIAKPSKEPDVLQLVEQRLSLREARAEKAKFEDEYKDLFSDPYLAKLVEQRDTELSQTDQQTPYTKRWRQAAEDVKTWALKMKGSTSLQDKAARKASVTPIPSATGRRSEERVEDVEEDPSQTIAEMAKARQGRQIQQKTG